MRPQGSDLSTALKAIHQLPITFYPCYADMMGSVAGGVILSQLMYWYSTQQGAKFSRKDEELRERTHVTDRELREAKAKLKAMAFLTITREGLPRTTWYEVDPEALLHALSVPTSPYTVVPTVDGENVRTSPYDGVRTVSDTVVPTEQYDGVPTTNNERARPDLRPDLRVKKDLGKENPLLSFGAKESLPPLEQKDFPALHFPDDHDVEAGLDALAIEYRGPTRHAVALALDERSEASLKQLTAQGHQFDTLPDGLTIPRQGVRQDAVYPRDDLLHRPEEARTKPNPRRKMAAWDASPLPGARGAMDAHTVLDHLCRVTGRRYRTMTHIAARLQGDATVAECLLVIDWWRAVKVTHDQGQEFYFDNETPFRATKFDKYRAAAQAWDASGRRTHSATDEAQQASSLAAIERLEQEGYFSDQARDVTPRQGTGGSRQVLQGGVGGRVVEGDLLPSPGRSAP